MAEVRLVGGDPLEPVQLFPLHYPWAYAHVQQAKHNTWFPKKRRCTMTCKTGTNG